MDQNKAVGKLMVEENVPQFLTTAMKNCQPPDLFFFYDKYKFYPSTISLYLDETSYVPFDSFTNFLATEYNHKQSDNDLCSFIYKEKSKKMYIDTQLTDFQNGVMFQFGYSFYDDEKIYEDEDDDEKHYFLTSIKALFLPSQKQFVEDFLKKVERKRKMLKDTTLQMICKNQYGLYLNEINIKKPKIKDLKIHYGNAFASVHDKILNTLKEKNSHGLVLLHGLPGTGKTHYIRYLIQEISEKPLIYVPPDLASCISTPEFLPFMLQHTDSILIIEDAENIIKSRDLNSNSTQAVANLLNLSDGLLGDSLRQPIIATFNCDLDSIDPALLRKGRLIAHHEFNKLDIENAQLLSNQLGFTTTITEPMSLADIYGQ